MKTHITSFKGSHEAGDQGSPERSFVEEGELGRGGMAVVRRVFDPRILRRAAMKRLESDREDAQQRFVDEAQITGQLEHPNIVPIHEFGVDAEGSLYMNMKLIHGKTLTEIVKEAGLARLQRDRLGDLVQVLIKVCDAVAYAHSRDVVHCDLKPSNIMIGDFGEVYVLDWGLARVLGRGGEGMVSLSRDAGQSLDRAGQIAGSPAFMAPEQAAAEHGKIDSRTDVFGLGAVLYFVLAGIGPYGKASLLHMLYKAQSGQLTPLSQIEDLPAVPVQLERIATRAMAHAPEDRYQTVVEIRLALQQFLRGTWSFPTVKFGAGELILREGEPGDTAYVVVEGRCEVFTMVEGERRTLREIGPNEAFGETAVFTRSPRTASVRAVTDVELIEVSESALAEGLGLNSWMGTFVRALADRFREVDERLRRREGSPAGRG